MSVWVRVDTAQTSNRRANLTRQTLRTLRFDEETVIKYRYVCYHNRTDTFINDVTGFVQTDCLDCEASADTEMLISLDSVPLDTYYGPVQVEAVGDA